MKIKINHKKIILIILMLVLSFAVLNTVSAAITSVTNGDCYYTTDEKTGQEIEVCYDKAGGVSTNSDSFANGAMAAISKVLEYVLMYTAGGSFAAIGITIVALAGVMLVLLNTLFAVGSGTWSSAMPDAIVFNKVPLMDANFINPHNYSFWNLINGNMAANLFESFRVIAISVMIIAAMITGLKLALSSIAAKKAQYKEAVMKWAAGFAILLCLKWLMAGIFYINELLVANFAATAETSNFTIPIYLTDAVPLVGKLLSDVTKWISSLWGGDGTPLYLPGYWGIVFSNMLRGIGGDIVSSIVAFVVIGQAFVVVGSYFKRLFMCFILGVVSPIIVAVDTITGIVGGKSAIFQNWLKNFIFTVFTQSFHAAYMIVGFMILKNVYTSTFNYTIQGVVTIFILTGLVKLEKVLKGMFGFGDGMAGSLSDGSKGLQKALGAAAGIAKASKALGDNKTKAENASRKRERATYEANKATAYQNAKNAKASGNMAEYYKQREIWADNSRKLKEFDAKYGVTGVNGSPQTGTQDFVQSAIANNSKPQTAEEANAALTRAKKEERNAKIASLMGAANLAAGIGIGLGSGDDIGEALFKGGYITSGLDSLAERGYFLQSRGERAEARQQANERREASRQQWRDAEGFSGKTGVVAERIVEKNTDAIDKLTKLFNTSAATSKSTGTNTSQTQQQVNLTVDTAKIAQEISRELNKAVSGIGQDVGRAIREELKHIDRDIDNE